MINGKIHMKRIQLGIAKVRVVRINSMIELVCTVESSGILMPSDLRKRRNNAYTNVTTEANIAPTYKEIKGE